MTHVIRFAKRVYTHTVSNLNFYHHLMDTTIDYLFMYVLLPKAKQSALLKTLSPACLTSTYKCSNGSFLSGQATTGREFPFYLLLRLSIDLAIVCDMWDLK